MAIHFGNGSTGYLPVSSPACAGSTVQNFYELDIAGKTLALNDVIDLGPLPANCTVGDVFLITDDIDTNGTPLISLDAGLMSGAVGENNAARTVGQELFAASTIARTGGVERASRKEAFRIAPVGYDRSLGLKVTAAPATQATTGKIGLLVTIRA
jgi:hypothetical protein